MTTLAKKAKSQSKIKASPKLGGCAIGAICDDIGTWMLIGLMLGVALGLASSNDRPQNKN